MNEDVEIEEVNEGEGKDNIIRKSLLYEKESEKKTMWYKISTAIAIIMLIIISVFCYIFYTDLYYVRNSPCTICVEKNDNAECYLNNRHLYKINDRLYMDNIPLTLKYPLK